MIIGIIGYGKMGKKIEELSLMNKHQIGFKLNSQNSNLLNIQNINKIDVAIEFSNPNQAAKNIAFCLENNTPIVSGTTGWLHQMPYIKNMCHEKKGSFFYAENFSLSVNLFLKTIEHLSKYVKSAEYDINITETHHKTKKDTPSGTALLIQKKIIHNIQTQLDISINSKRIGNIHGEHTVQYKNENDIIEISHKANNRNSFAKGAILAAEFIQHKKGVFSMEDLINNY